MTKNNFHKKLPNCEDGTILKRQISQKFFTSYFMLPDSKKVFDALATQWSDDHAHAVRFHL